MIDAIDTQEHRGYKIKIYADDCAENPREAYDHLGTVKAWHGRHTLSDTGADSSSPADFIEFVKATKPLLLPLYLLDHSGLRLSTGLLNHVDPGGWDSGQVGYIYAERADILKAYDSKRLTAKIKRLALAALAAEGSEYDDYLSGNVYGYGVENQAGEEIDSCRSYYGYPEKSGLIADAKSFIDWHIANTIKRHVARLKDQIRHRAPLSARQRLEV